MNMFYMFYMSGALIHTNPAEVRAECVKWKVYDPQLQVSASFCDIQEALVTYSGDRTGPPSSITGWLPAVGIFGPEFQAPVPLGRAPFPEVCHRQSVYSYAG